MTPGSNPASDPSFTAGLRPIPSRPAGAAVPWPATDITGKGPDGTPIEIRIASADRPILLIFLATRCDGCADYWYGLADQSSDPTTEPSTSGPGPDPTPGLDVGDTLARVMPVVVTRGPRVEAAAEVAAVSAGARRTPVVMSDQAWKDYRVTAYPFFVLVDPGSGRIIGETVGFGWSDVAAMVVAASR